LINSDSVISPLKHSFLFLQTIQKEHQATMTDMKTYGERIIFALEQRKRQAQWLSEKTGLSVQAIGQCVNGRTKAFTSENNTKVAIALDLDSDWLATGNGAWQRSGADENVTLLVDAKKVPLVGWVSAGAWVRPEVAFDRNEADDWLSCPIDHGARTFALKIKGQSMSNPMAEPSFHEDDIIFVDPDRAWHHRSLIVAQLDDSAESTFKRLLIDGEQKYLEALNPSWPNRIMAVTGPFSILGVVIAQLKTL
jgi:SOS-response transcriptional repressor LexA